MTQFRPSLMRGGGVAHPQSNPVDEGGMAWPQLGHAEVWGHGLALTRWMKGAWPGSYLVVWEEGGGPAPTHPAGLEILAAGRGSNTATASPPSNFSNHGEPHRLDSNIPWAGFNPQTRG